MFFRRCVNAALDNKFELRKGHDIFIRKKVVRLHYIVCSKQEDSCLKYINISSKFLSFFDYVTKEFSTTRQVAFSGANDQWAPKMYVWRHAIVKNDNFLSRIELSTFESCHYQRKKIPSLLVMLYWISECFNS